MVALMALALACSGAGPQDADEAGPPPAAAAPSAQAAAGGASEADGASGRAGGRLGKIGKQKLRAPTPPTDPPAVSVPVSDAERAAGLVARCSTGEVVFNGWPGEYPDPVVQVDTPQSLPVAADPCGPANRRCAVGAGLLHPWAKPPQRPGPLTFAQRTEVARFRLERAHRLGGAERPAGTVVELWATLAEGFCRLRVADAFVEAECPGVRRDDPYVALDTAQRATVQLVEVPCTDGTQGWLAVNDALLARAGVRTGETVGFGAVRRAE